MTKIVAYVPDLMDRSKLAAAAPGINFVRTPAELALATADAELVLLDLSRAGVLEALPDLKHARTIGFGSHVDRDLLDAATAAGCDQVLPRSKFFGGLSELLA